MNNFASAFDQASKMLRTENGALQVSIDVLSPVAKWMYRISQNRHDIGLKRNSLTSESIEKRFSILETELSNEIVNLTRSRVVTPEIVARFLVYARDPRNGMGERSLFRTVISELINQKIFKPKDMTKFCETIVNHGRYDDLIALFASTNSEVKSAIRKYICARFKKDVANLRTGELHDISLLAKWMPSANASSNVSKKIAFEFMRWLKLTPKSYRKKLSALRNHLHIVERNVCQKNYENIDYSAVPSLAMNLYKNNFMQNDKENFSEYLESVKNGTQKINASVITPVEVAANYVNNKEYYFSELCENATVEAQWKALPNIEITGNILPVIDMSGSMSSNITDKINSLCVSIGMGIYLSEHSKGDFKNKALIFADESNPIDFSRCDSLYEKIKRLGNDIGYSTNVESALMTVLRIAEKSHCKQEEIPTLVFITDGEFNEISENGEHEGYFSTLFEQIGKRFEEKNYKMPKLVFWNTQNRTRGVPVTENENGLILLSGFSPIVLRMVMSNCIDPLSTILEEIGKADYNDAVNLF